MKIALFETRDDERYESRDGVMVIAREYGETPNGNPLNGRWVLRRNGEFVDFDKYRNDLAEHNNLELHGT